MRILDNQQLIYISKPRCGSTSLRKILDQYSGQAPLYCWDVANEHPIFHPHITAPALLNYLADTSPDRLAYKLFTVIRDPLKMLYSYFKFFKPDINMRFNFEDNYCPDQCCDFVAWLRVGCVPSSPLWLPHGPRSIDVSNFSPLSIEAHALNESSSCLIHHIFQIENPSSITAFLARSLRLSELPKLISINHSENITLEDVIPDCDQGDDILDRLVKSFPFESHLYGYTHKRPVYFDEVAEKICQ